MSAMESGARDLASIASALSGLRGRSYWRALEELAEDPSFAEIARASLPGFAEGLLAREGRRDFLRLMGASLALGGLGACTRQPAEAILPYARSPEQIVPGEPLFYASAAPLLGDAVGVLVESHMGRPTKIEGNPDHPASLGSTDALTQAAVLDLYDPHRAQVITRAGRIRTRADFFGELRERLNELGARGGAGLAVLSPSVTSPTLSGQMAELRALYPKARWVQHEPVRRDRERAGLALAFGHDLIARYAFASAERVVALEADFLTAMPGRVRYARDFSERRRSDPGRFYAVESSPTITGAQADQRLALPPSQIEDLALVLARGLGVPLRRGETGPALPPRAASFADALVRDLRQHGRNALVVVGESLSPMAHALGAAMNASLGSIGQTVEYTEPIDFSPPDQLGSLRRLCEDMRAGSIDLLIVLGGNPVYDAPRELDFKSALESVPLRVHLSLHADETSQVCHWHLPRAHWLETWSDARCYDGTSTILQPLIAPLYGGMSDHELVAALCGRMGESGHAIVRKHWRLRLGATEGDFERAFARALHDGLVAETRAAARAVALQEGFASAAVSARDSRSTEPSALELCLRPDASVFDGRFASNGWLQELPRPFTKLTWGNAALLSPATASALGVEDDDVVELESSAAKLQVPALLVPGHAEGCVTLHLGYGRAEAGPLGTGVGSDAYVFTEREGAHSIEVRASRTGQRRALARTQHHHRMEGRDLVREQALGEHASPHAPEGHGDTSLYPPFPRDNLARGEGHAWGMVIDLNSCIGCNACVIACQAENNVPIVGETEVRRGREMHWIRIDGYIEPDEAPERPAGAGIDTPSPRFLHQPVPCMHCETAPCEVVCPVGATVHGDEGLNEMVYNRCIGTRYCANNCPYKVRRFNFFRYIDDAPSLALQRNPDVTVRTRGVMEKCTYCVQRINHARIASKREGRELRDGEIQTACQAVCPARAISFGDLNDPASAVSRLREHPRHYGLLEELNTRPRTTYLARVRNRNPELTGI